jgi:hypothetical protein
VRFAIARSRFVLPDYFAKLHAIARLDGMTVRLQIAPTVLPDYFVKPHKRRGRWSYIGQQYITLSIDVHRT